MIAGRFDYVILGGGTAACVLVHQLLKRGNFSIALVEAGGGPTGKRIHTPALYPTIWGGAKDWKWKTVPQPNLWNRRISWPRGKMLGGSSNMNAMILSFGHPDDQADYPDGFDFAAAIDSCSSLRDESRLGESSNGEASNSVLSRSFLEAAKQCEDTNFEAIEFAKTIRNGRRFSAYHAFLQPLLSHPMLTVFENSQALHVCFADQRAIGAEIQIAGQPQPQILAANRQVILCGGTIGSPEILMRSGIGWAEDLAALQVETVVECEAVGKHLQDHLAFPIIAAVCSSNSLPPISDIKSRLEYAKNRGGPLASNLAEVGAFFSLDSNSKRPDFQIHFTPTHYLKYPLGASWTAACSLALTPLHPRSTGRVSIDPATRQLQIDPAYLSNQSDLDEFIAAIRRAGNLLQCEPLAQSICDEYLLLPRCRLAQLESFEGLAETIQKRVSSIFHPVGTCGMGRVVNQRFEVVGVDGLSVVDASVIPAATTGNPQVIVMALASAAIASLIG